MFMYNVYTLKGLCVSLDKLLTFTISTGYVNI